jgi:hypothetical protein
MIQTTDIPLFSTSRSGIHATTKKHGQFQRDDPHITISVKNPQTQANGSHQTSHGYTETMTSARVARVVANNFLNFDSHNNIWPFGLPEEEIYGMPGELGYSPDPGPGPGPGYTFGNPMYPPPDHGPGPDPGPGYTFGNPMYPPPGPGPGYTFGNPMYPPPGPGSGPGPGYTFWNPMYPPR